MEHVLFVIIYAATLNGHKLFVWVNFVFGLMTKTKDSSYSTSRTYTSTYRGILCGWSSLVQNILSPVSDEEQSSIRYAFLWPFHWSNLWMAQLYCVSFLTLLLRFQPELSRKGEGSTRCSPLIGRQTRHFSATVVMNSHMLTKNNRRLTSLSFPWTVSPDERFHWPGGKKSGQLWGFVVVFHHASVYPDDHEVTAWTTDSLITIG